MVVIWALWFAAAALALAMLLCTIRLVRGPLPTDRVLALDTLYINAAALAIVLDLVLGTDVLFEAALLIALLGFVSTVALSRFLGRGDTVE
jgi:multicomponent K+:H+ antiporter subunit F